MGKRTQRANNVIDAEPACGMPNFEKISRHLRANLPTKMKFFGKKPAEYFSGKKLIEFLEESEFYNKEEGDDGCLYGAAELQDVGMRLMAMRRMVRCEFYEKKIKKKDGKIKMRKELRPVMNQVFDSTTDIPYVWTYDPVTQRTVLYGLLLLGSIAACVALPMWPAWIRNIVIAILMFILVGRPLIWLVVYLVTFSRWNLYILPKLDEDACPFDKRFWPIWEFERSETASTADDDDDEGDGDSDNEGDAAGSNEDGDANSGDDGDGDN